MNKLGFSWSKFYSMPLIGIMRNIPVADVDKILPLYHCSGLTNLEITMNSPGCEEGIRLAVQEYGDHINVGAGTVCTEEDLYKALKAGARFIVTPVIDAKIISVCKKEQIPIFAGAFTPTEICLAWNLGVDVVKVFPAVCNGLEYMKAVRGPFPQIKLLPTGGVDLDNSTDFMQAGATGLGIGSQLFNNQLIKSANWASLSAHFSAFTGKLAAFSR
jgi:2-dehydro-3-deoxyphosphogluconate aldolase/(4S)-4-hydroxy-2-oxoglutarate aldolase